MVAEINSQNFDNEVVNSDGLVVVDFYADWCGPCRKMSPIMDEIESEISSKAKFVKINTDENLEKAREYQISGLPTLMMFKNGKPIERLVGLMPKDSIITNIEKYV